MNRFVPVLAVIVLIGAGAAHADIVSSNIQPGDLFGPGVGIGLVPFTGVFNYAGIGFTPSQTYVFDSAELPISLSSGPNVLNVYLMGSGSGLPSGVLESFDLNNAMSTNPSTSLVTIDSVTHPLLDAGMQYWIVAAGARGQYLSPALSSPAYADASLPNALLTAPKKSFSFPARPECGLAVSRGTTSRVCGAGAFACQPRVAW